jgi:hypothetical protein
MREQLVGPLVALALVAWIGILFISNRELWWLIHISTWSVTLLAAWFLTRRRDRER